MWVAGREEHVVWIVLFDDSILLVFCVVIRCLSIGVGNRLPYSVGYKCFCFNSTLLPPREYPFLRTVMTCSFVDTGLMGPWARQCSCVPTVPGFGIGIETQQVRWCQSLSSTYPRLHVELCLEWRIGGNGDLPLVRTPLSSCWPLHALYCSMQTTKAQWFRVVTQGE